MVLDAGRIVRQGDPGTCIAYYVAQGFDEDASTWTRPSNARDTALAFMRDFGEWDGSDLPSASRRQFLEWLGAYLETQSISDPDLAREWRRQMRQFTSPLLYRASSLARRLRGPSSRDGKD